MTHSMLARCLRLQRPSAPLRELLQVSLVTADGLLVSASSTQNEELFWGLHGEVQLLL